MINKKWLFPLFLIFAGCALGGQIHEQEISRARKSAPMYWTIYEYCIENNAPILEERWQQNIDWMAETFRDYGYDMICNDGWIETAQTIDKDGYITKYNSYWKGDFAYWNAYIHNKGMKSGVYYNPLWITRTAYEQNCPISGTGLHIRDITGGHWFNSELGWVDVNKEGAEQWVKGYVRYLIELGFVYLRMDFLENYENNYGTERYDKALRWIAEAAGDKIFLSLVMPNCNNDSEVELKYGDMMRISDDCYGGGWDFVSDRRRGVVNDRWPRYWNAFDGFVAFSDTAERGNIIMDGDFMRLNTMATGDEKRFLFSLMCLTGSALAIADQWDTIGDDALIYQNRELIEMNQRGFVARPLSTDLSDRERSSVWVGQLSDNEWVVGLFNREETAVEYGVDLQKDLGIEGKVSVRDLWEKGLFETASDKYNATLAPHTCKIIKIVISD